MQHQRTAVCLTVCAIAFAFVGCSSVRPPRAEIATAEFAIQNAQKTSAPQNSALELRLAREKLERAKTLMRGENYVMARRMAEEAQVDAELAESKARSQDAVKTARQLREGIESLRREAVRAGG